MNITYEQLVEKLKVDLAASHSLPAGLNVWIIALLVIIGLVLVWLSVYTVKTQEYAIIERFGQYEKTARPGLHFKIPFIDRIKIKDHLMIRERIVKVETITTDKVSVVLTVPVQFNVMQDHEYDAEYRLTSVFKRLESLVFDEVRSAVPKLTLDQVFNSKDEIATGVRDLLRADLNPFGYEIDRVMITEVEPDAKVKAAMNDINASKKEGEAKLSRAQNEQQVQVAQAEGRLKAADLNKQADLIDAAATAGAIAIIGDALDDNHEYLQFKWIHMMEQRDSGDTIYVPTEAGLPILEAGKRSAKVDKNFGLTPPTAEA